MSDAKDDKEYDTKEDDKATELMVGEAKLYDAAPSCREEKQKINSMELVQKIEAYFYTDDSLAAEFEAFVAQRAHIFASVAHVEVQDVEYKLQYTEVYDEYKALFELKIESFIQSQGVSVNEFFDILQEKTNADKDSSEAFFAQMLLAVTEFDVFIMMMKEAAQAQNPYDPEAAAKVLEDESNSRK